MSQATASPKITITPLDENCADIVEWFRRYEIHGEMFGWKKTEGGDTRVQYLPLFLSGLVLVSFNHFEESIKKDYEKGKTAIIQRYGLKASEAYRRFVNGRFTPGTPVDGFVDELKRLLSFVTNLSGTAQESLVLNQLLLSLPSEVAEKITLSLDNPAEPTLAAVMEKARAVNHNTAGPTCAVAVASNPNATVRSTPATSTTKTAMRCYNCNDFGHIAVDCPKPRRQRATKSVAWNLGPKNAQRGA